MKGRRNSRKTVGTWWVAQDWLADPNVQVCSDAAKGFWIDLLSLMVARGSHGHLPGRLEVIARLRGIPPELCGAWAQLKAPRIAELERRGVLSRGGWANGPGVRPGCIQPLPDDAIVCRRMWRHWARQEALRQRGKVAAAARWSGKPEKCGMDATAHAKSMPEVVDTTGTYEESGMLNGMPSVMPDDMLEGMLEGIQKACLNDAKEHAKPMRSNEAQSVDGTGTYGDGRMLDPMLEASPLNLNLNRSSKEIDPRSDPDTKDPWVDPARGKGLSGSVHSNPVPIGDLLKAPPVPPAVDRTGDLVAWAVRITGDTSFERTGHRERIRRIQSTSGGLEAVERLLDRVEKESNPYFASRRGVPPIEKPAAYLASALMELDPDSEGSE